MQGRPAKTIRALRTHLDESLFLSAPSRNTALGRGERLVVVLALVVLAVILQLLRVGPSEALDSLWAEDGQIFFQGALTQDLWHTVFSPYAGYLVLAPRLIGEIANLAPLRDAAAATAIAAGVVVAVCGLAVWYASAAHIRNPYLRGTLVLVTVLAPVAGLESVASGSYVLWYMLFASFWLLLWRPTTMRGAVLASLFLLVTGLSTPGLWFFAPLAALRTVAVRDRRDLLIVSSYAIGAAVQVPVIALNSEAAVKPLWSSDIWTAYAQRVVDGAALGERVGGIAWAQLGWPFLALLLASAVAGLVAGLRRSDASGRWLAAIAIPTSLLLFVVSLYQRAVASQMVWPAGVHFGAGGRYTIVPALLLVSVALVLIDRSSRSPRRLSPTVIAAVAVLVLVVATSLDVRETAARGNPPWGDSLTAAAHACSAEDLPAARIATSPPGFGVTIPCDRLVSPSVAPPAR